MSETDPATAPPVAQPLPPKAGRIQDFIFGRELAEVYLLLDHVSGRSDKSLATAFGDEKEGNAKIREICAIGWPPEAGKSQPADDASTLLMAKDRLNYAAKPATGASIAFTHLVAGNDEVTARRQVSWSGSLKALVSRGPKTPAPEPSDIRTYFEGDLPSRMSLAKSAYPGFVATAERFNRRLKWLVGLLFVWLAFTCVLSWNIAAGRAILVRLDAAKSTLAATDKRIAEIESSESLKRQQAPPIQTAVNATPALATTATIPSPTARNDTDSSSKAMLIQRYCEHAQMLPPLQHQGGMVPQFESATQYQLCDERRDGSANVDIIRRDLSVWLSTWGWIRAVSKDDIAKGRTESLPTAFDVWAAIVAEILATAVLPICYGFLGAGAAVVRGIYAKMHDSLLLPRELTQAWGQLALGAVIGACIGLFVSPPSGGAQGVSLISGASTLSLAALSFIAGFGVESVIVAFESLIRRIFNVSPPAPTQN